MEVSIDNCGKLLIHISEHVKVLGILRICGVYIIPSALTEGPVILNILNSSVSRGCVRENTSNLVLLCPYSKVTLDREVFMISCETCQTVKSRVGITSLFLNGLIWKIDSELHLAIVDLAPVLYCLK